MLAGALGLALCVGAIATEPLVPPAAEPSGPALPASDAEHALRVGVHVDEEITVPTPPLQGIVLLDEHVAKVQAGPTGLIIRGLTTGRTQVQLFTPAGLRVMVIVVRPAVAKPAAAGQNALQATPGERGPLKSFWGLNAYNADVTWNSLLGVYSRHALSLSGLVQGGEYDFDASAQIGALGSRFQRGRLAWTNKERTFGFELGDTAMRVPGSELTSSYPVRGLHLRHGTDRFTQELFLGGSTALGSAGFNQPLVGGSLSGAVPWGRGSPLILRHAESVLGFLTAATRTTPAHIGVLAGTQVRLEQPQRFSVELRSSGQVVTPRGDGPPTSVGGELGATATLGYERWSANLDYQGTFGTVYMLTAGMHRWPSHRIGGGFDVKLNSSLVANASGNYVVLWDEQGRSTSGVSGNLGLQYYISSQTRLQLQASQVTSALFVGVGESSVLARTLQRSATAAVTHQFDPMTQGQAAVTYQRNISGTSGKRDVLTFTALASRQATLWQATAAASVSGYRDDVLAEDRPLVIQAAASATGRLILGRFESFAGVGLQRELLPGTVRGIAGTVNVGVQFMPTIAHRLLASYTLSAPMSGAPMNHNVSVSYAFLFGDSVRAPPIFEFLSHGKVRGRVCVDRNMDGECQVDEPGVPKVTVRLSGGKTTQSDALGQYLFEDLKPGYYHVDVDEAALRPLGRMTTAPMAEVEVPSRGEATARFGVFQGCEVIGRVVNDLDLDGARGPNDALLPAVSIQVVGEGTRYQAISDGFGTFNVRVKQCGEYQVSLEDTSLPPQYRVVLAEAKTHVTSEERSSGVDLFVSAIRTVQGTVFFDANRNGRREPHEPAVPGVRIRWSGGASKAGDNGAFLLRRLPAGSIHLEVDPDTVPAEMRPGPGHEVLLPAGPATLDGHDLPLLPHFIPV